MPWMPETVCMMTICLRTTCMGYILLLLINSVA